jgi:integrase
MASLFRPTITRYVSPDGKQVPKNFPGAKKKNIRSKTWYAQYRDAGGTLRRKPLSTNKAVAQQELRKLVEKVERERNGQHDPYEGHRKTSLADHLVAYRSYLAGKGNDAEYIDQTVHRVELLIDGCGFQKLGDIAAAAVTDWLQLHRDEGAGYSTSNSYLTSIKGFCKWAVRDRRTTESPVAHLTALNIDVDVRLVRRALEADELRLLIQVAQKSPKRFRGLSGSDRAMLYLTAAYAGLRASELASLTPASLDLDSECPTITVDAGDSKRRRRDVQPIPPWLARRLASWLAEKGESGILACDVPSTIPVRPESTGAGHRHRNASPVRQTLLWPGTWPERAADMVRADLAASRTVWLLTAPTDDLRAEWGKTSFLTDQDEAGAVVDFHALRHTYVSSLAAAGVHPKIAQQLARHSDINLTMNTYSHVRGVDVAAALDHLP